MCLLYLYIFTFMPPLNPLKPSSNILLMTFLWRSLKFLSYLSKNFTFLTVNWIVFSASSCAKIIIEANHCIHFVRSNFCWAFCYFRVAFLSITTFSMRFSVNISPDSWSFLFSYYKPMKFHQKWRRTLYHRYGWHNGNWINHLKFTFYKGNYSSLCK